MIYMPIAAALIGLVYMLIKKSWVMKQDAGDGKMKEISAILPSPASCFNTQDLFISIYAKPINAAAIGM